MDSNNGDYTRSRRNANGNNNDNNTNDKGHEHESSDAQEEHVNVQNGPNESNTDNAIEFTLLNFLMTINSMLMMESKSLANKTSNGTMIAPNLNKLIPGFDGLTRGAPAETWLRTVNDVAKSHQLSDNCKLQLVRANLKGFAHHWFKSRNIEDWADFENRFRKTFIGIVMSGDRWNKMYHRMQPSTENTRQYFKHKMYLCKQLGLPFYESKIHLLEGLYSHDLAMYLLYRDHRGESHLLSDILDYEQLNTSRSMRSRQSSTTIKDNNLYKPTPLQQNDAPPSKTTNKESMGNSTTDYKGKPTRQKVRSCFNCGSKTHISPQCPKPKKGKGACYECGSTLHQIRECPKRTRQNPDAANDSVHNLKTFKVQCYINISLANDENVKVKFIGIINPNSPISLLQRQFIPNNYTLIKPVCNNNFCGIDGSKFNILGIFRSNITIGNIDTDFTFFIIPNSKKNA
ncbi:uncharacterized protein LOC112688712 [Sipha flava]|uniref:Uncharacterized protein LOC112688712 n=1 Tax=Sipha flava TaxID=143950 RepID=A0A8B8G563_9HEMI|nr:uncharacterized protein LOC112688712 [Sipha flava]XP_025417831.1 uncharacterized protein LOC112688712 [Sipha flava]